MHASCLRLKQLLVPSLVMISCASLFGCAGSSSSDVAEGGKITSTLPPPFSSGIYRGTIGPDQVEMRLQLDANSTDSLHGWYAVAGDQSKSHVLLAGELEDEALSMEESINGVDVSGHFNAVIAPASFSGEWSDTNGEHVQQIEFRRVQSLPAVP